MLLMYTSFEKTSETDVLQFDDRVPNIRVPRAPEGELSRGCFNQSAMMKPHPTDC